MVDKERMTVVDARKMLQIMNDCCKGLVFTKDEIRQISIICLKSIERLNDSVPCSLKDELPKQTNGNWIRNMNNAGLADYIYGISEGTKPCVKCNDDCDFCECSAEECIGKIKEWLEKEVEE